MTTATYSIEDEHGNSLTEGLQEHEAHRVAQRMADRRGEPVYLWAPGAEEAEEISPSEAE